MPSVSEPAQDVYEVHGMTCASCAKRVEKAIGRVDGVESVHVDLVRERARIVGHALEHELALAVSKAGFELTLRDQTAPKPRGVFQEGEPRALAAVLVTVPLLALDLF